jgi:type II restriction/modification system DNA methylase subunit YeeA
MNTNNLKRFAKEARIKLLDQVGRKLEFVLTHDTSELRGKQKEIEQLKKKITEQGKEQVIEMVSYTWFNRLMALRFMDANGYTIPKVITPIEGMTNPEILQNALGGNIEPELKLDRQRLNDLLDGKTAATDAHTEAYKMLLVASCNQWHTAMPFMFERISDYTELLLPDDLLSDYSIVADMRNGMSEEDCKQEEILGWLYQFYISDENERLIKSKSVYKKHELAPASQLFTPKWIVKYMVDNTLGQLWSEINPYTNILSKLEFYIKPAYKEQLQPRTKKKLEEIKFFEPCVGSAHILSYAFDVFYLMYEEQGYSTTEIPELIIKHNLFGVDIDERAAQIASFVLMMKGRRKNSRFLRKNIAPNITFYEDFDEDTKFNNCKALGSLVNVEPTEIENIKVNEGSVFADRQKKLKQLYTFLGQRYDCVVTNPPYISSSRMEGSVKQFVESKYPDTKSDLFATFIIRCLELCNEDGFTGYMTPFVWMFISSYEKLRENIIDNHFVNNLIQLEYSGFDGATVPVCAFTLRNNPITDAKGSYVRLSDFKGSENQAPKTLEAIKNNNCGWFFTANQNEFENIPGSPIGYWISNSGLKALANSRPLVELCEPRKGMCTRDNDHFVRFWFEISFNKIGFDKSSRVEAKNSEKKWFPYQKGGDFRQWYGNNLCVVDWENDGYKLLHMEELGWKGNSTNHNMEYIFKPALIWSKITSAFPSFRIVTKGFLFDDASGLCHVKREDDMLKILGLLCSKVGRFYIGIINPTLNIQPGNMASIPLIFPTKTPDYNQIINISESDWDTFELSWNFKSFPLINPENNAGSIKSTFNLLRDNWNNLTMEMLDLEEENNRIFIDCYGLSNDLSAKVLIQEITLRNNPYYRYGKDKDNNEVESFLLTDTLKEFVSYSIGCFFGRYSLNKPSLILANQGEALQDFLKQVPNPTYMPDEDNIIPVLDGEWFNDDIVGRFKVFLKAAFGEEHFEENLKYIEETIGKDIRKYFVKDFYIDHIKRYKKRPIYWMFSSPKGHFKALIYMHRYQPDLCSKMLNDYLQAFISKLEAAKQTQTMLSLREDISAREKTIAIKEIDKYEAMLKDCREYEKIVFTIATQKISIDLDDGVKVNYQKFKEVLVPIKGLEKEEE